MGADFYCSVCPAPPDITPEVKVEIERRVLALEKPIIDRVAEDYHYDWESEIDERIEGLSEEHLFRLNDIRSVLKKELVQEMIMEALEEVIFDKNRRDLAEIILDHKIWLISGGMSWGDSPTEAMNYIDIINTSSILEGLNDLK